MKFYIERSFIINKFIKLQTITNTIDCKVVDINYDGELIIEHENQLKTVTSAEIIKTYI